MEIPLERLVEIVVREVFAALAKRGVPPGLPHSGSAAVPAADSAARVALDMSGYRTPVLTENRVRSLGRHVREITVPAGTVCTTGARDVIHQRKMILTFTGNNH